MPPKGEPLSAARRSPLLRAWIDQGLPWEAGFTFKVDAYVAPLKPRRPELPPARDGRDHPIDRILDAYFAGTRSRRPRRWTTRRSPAGVYLDVIGLLPTPAGAGGVPEGSGRRQARAADPPAARRPPRLTPTTG